MKEKFKKIKWWYRWNFVMTEEQKCEWDLMMYGQSLKKNGKRINPKILCRIIERDLIKIDKIINRIKDYNEDSVKDWLEERDVDYGNGNKITLRKWKKN